MEQNEFDQLYDKLKNIDTELDNMHTKTQNIKKNLQNMQDDNLEVFFVWVDFLLKLSMLGVILKLLADRGL